MGGRKLPGESWPGSNWLRSFPESGNQRNQKPIWEESQPESSADFGQHSTKVTARPPRDVSLYFSCMSRPVSRMVVMA